MKTHKYLVLVSTLTLSALLIAGCASLTSPGEPQEVSVTQPVFGLDPNTGAVVQVGTTNITGTITPHTVNSNLMATLQASQAAFTAAGSIPSPASPVLFGLSALMGLLGTGATIYAKKKSGLLTTSNAALAATITAIEAAEQAAAIKKAVQLHAVANGSQDFLDQKVQEISFKSP